MNEVDKVDKVDELDNELEDFKNLLASKLFQLIKDMDILPQITEYFVEELEKELKKTEEEPTLKITRANDIKVEQCMCPLGDANL